MSDQKIVHALPYRDAILRRFVGHCVAEMDIARSHYPWWPTDVVHAAVVVAEEANELLKAANEIRWNHKGTSPDALLEELIQTVAMCFRFYLETVIDQEDSPIDIQPAKE